MDRAKAGDGGKLYASLAQHCREDSAHYHAGHSCSDGDDQHGGDRRNRDLRQQDDEIHEWNVEPDERYAATVEVGHAAGSPDAHLTPRHLGRYGNPHVA